MANKITDNSGQKYEVTFKPEDDAWFIVVKPKAKESCNTSKTGKVTSDEQLTRRETDVSENDDQNSPQQAVPQVSILKKIIPPVDLHGHNADKSIGIDCTKTKQIAAHPTKKCKVDSNVNVTGEKSLIKMKPRCKSTVKMKPSVESPASSSGSKRYSTGKSDKFHVQPPERKKILQVLVTCTICSSKYLTRTREGAPYTDDFLANGISIHCTTCEDTCLADCNMCNQEDSIDDGFDLNHPLIACVECSCTFERLGSYGQHKLKHKDDPVVCELCDKIFKNQHKLSAHCAVVHRDKSLDKVCDECAKPFKNNNELRRHKQSVHVQKEQIKCEICEKILKTKYGLKTHMSLHQKKHYLCPFCGKEFQSKAGYNSHYKTHVENNQCGICHKEFSSQDGLVKHRLVHDEDREIYTCWCCGKKFKSRMGFNKHMTKQHYHVTGNMVSTTFTTDTL